MSLLARIIDYGFAKANPPRDEKGNLDFVKLREQFASKEPPKTPKSLSLSLLQNEEIDGEIITPKESKGAIIYIHGGAFTTGSAKERRNITFYLAKKYSYRVISINYRLAPENKWPAQLEDCFKAYKYICENITKDVILMGESAGASLVLSLGLYAKEQKYILPKAIAAFSPVTNAYEQYPSHYDNIKTDKMLGDMVIKGLSEVLFEKEPSKEELMNPCLSPINGDYQNMPPIFLSASMSETLFDDSKYLYEKLVKENHVVEKDFQKRVCHAYPIFPFLKEAKTTLKKCFQFLNNLKD